MRLNNILIGRVFINVIRYILSDERYRNIILEPDKWYIYKGS